MIIEIAAVLFLISVYSFSVLVRMKSESWLLYEFVRRQLTMSYRLRFFSLAVMVGVSYNAVHCQ